jgi:hypothetical protein
MDVQDYVGITHHTYLQPWHPLHLPPFAMWSAFPTADYYGGSVPVGGAPFRESRVPFVTDVQGGLGASVVTFGPLEAASLLRNVYPALFPRAGL